MNCSVKIPALGLFAFLGVAIPIRASSIAVTYAFGGTATVVGATATTLTLEADAAGTFLSGISALNSSWNPITYSDLSVLDLNTGLLNGTFTFLFENGDTLLGNVSEDDSAVDASPTQTGPFTQTLTFTGGTGEFAGATGSVSGDGFVGTTDFSVSGSGSVNVTPEPTPGTLLLSGLALLLAGAWRSGGATTSGDIHAFLAVPCEGDESITPDARAQRVPVNLSHRARMLLFGRPGMSK